MEHHVLNFKKNVHNFFSLNNVQPTCNFEITHLAHKIFEFETCELGYGWANPGLNSRQRQELFSSPKPSGWLWESPSLLQ